MVDESGDLFRSQMLVRLALRGFGSHLEYISRRLPAAGLNWFYSATSINGRCAGPRWNSSIDYETCVPDPKHQISGLCGPLAAIIRRAEVARLELGEPCRLQEAMSGSLPWP